jgi:hypothetical protein
MPSFCSSRAAGSFDWHRSIEIITGVMIIDGPECARRPMTTASVVVGCFHGQGWRMPGGHDQQAIERELRVLLTALSDRVKRLRRRLESVELTDEELGNLLSELDRELGKVQAAGRELIEGAGPADRPPPGND